MSDISTNFEYKSASSIFSEFVTAYVNEKQRLEAERMQREKEEAERKEAERLRIETERLRTEAERAKQERKEKMKKASAIIAKALAILVAVAGVFFCGILLFKLFRANTTKFILIAIPVIMVIMSIIFSLKKGSLSKATVWTLSLAVCYGLSVWLFCIFKNHHYLTFSEVIADWNCLYDSKVIPSFMRTILALVTVIALIVIVIKVDVEIYLKIILGILSLFIYPLLLIILFVYPVGYILLTGCLLVLTCYVAYSVCDDIY
jgi:cation transport ATPase